MKYVGMQWSSTFNCWDFAKLIYLNELGVDASTEFDCVLKPIDSVESGIAISRGIKSWQEVGENNKKAFDLCLMGTHDIAHHIGVVIDQGLVIHLCNGSLSSAMKVRAAKKRFRTVKFYRHANHI